MNIKKKKNIKHLSALLCSVRHYSVRISIKKQNVADLFYYFIPTEYISSVFRKLILYYNKGIFNHVWVFDEPIIRLHPSRYTNKLGSEYHISRYLYNVSTRLNKNSKY